jgi:tyrosinase
MRVRRDVWKLAGNPNDQTLHWYSVAVSGMQARMFDSPISWRFQAAVHGYDASLYPPLRPGENLPTPAIQGKYWDNCQHASWWFLPWHRIYVFLFEKMCRDIIRKAGGPEDWALPYWNYSLPSSAVQRTLPAAFRNANSSPGLNPLFALRASGVNTGGIVGSDRQSENTTCMKSPQFSGNLPNGFGGGPSKVTQFSHYTGSCENGPHNYMHDAIGGPTGWMGNPDAAALDPIFWLHHSNIDRLWLIWTGTAPHQDPADLSWNNQAFQLFDNNGNPQNYKVSQVLKTTGPLCDYTYDDLINPLKQPPVSLAASGVRFGKAGKPTPAVPAAPPSAQVERIPEGSMRPSQLIGASAKPSVTLGTGQTSVALELHAPAVLPQFTEEAAPAFHQVYLALENVTAQEHPIHTYAVYVNLPENGQPANYPEQLAGLIPRFGLVKASKADVHGGQGLNLSFDITEIVSNLETNKAWDPENLRVTFVPYDVEQVNSALKGMAATIQPVKVGRISVYTQ